MTEIARGAIGDRPWGMTLGALGMRALSGQLTLYADNKQYMIAFSQGAVIGAYSPMASDAAVRIAMTGGLLSSTQVADIARRHQANPQRDEVELIAEAVRLVPDQAAKLRRRAVAQRAARTFSIERGEFIVDDRVTLPVVPGNELDIRAVIFLGAKTNMSEARLAAELAMFGSWFRLLPDSMVDLPQYGFGRNEDGVLDILEAGGALADLELVGSEAHIVRAMIYALATCNAVEMGQAPARAPAQPAQPARPPAPRPQATQRIQPQPAQQQRQPSAQPVQQAQRQAAPQTVQAAGSQGHARPQPAQTVQPQPQPPQRPQPTTHNFDAPTIRRTDVADSATVRQPQRQQPMPHAPRAQRPTEARFDPGQAVEVKKLIARHHELLKKRADHYQLLGTHIDATGDEIRKAYFAIARQLHPDRLSALGIADDNKDAQRLFAQVNTAFGVLSDPKHRQEYTSVLRRGGEAAVAAEEARAEELTQRILEAEECFRRGEAALRRDQLSTAIAEFQQAIELNPEEGDYVALHVWATFCAAPDKMAVAQITRTNLDRAISRSPRAIAPRFYLGRVERMLGRDADALRHFQEVVAMQPHHSEAATEIRVIEQRLAGAGKKR